MTDYEDADAARLDAIHRLTAAARANGRDEGRREAWQEIAAMVELSADVARFETPVRPDVTRRAVAREILRAFKEQP